MFEKISNREYHTRPGINKSRLPDLMPPNTPYYAKWLWDQPKPDIFEKTEEKFNVGGAFHLLMLQPELFKSSVSIMPDMGRRKNEEKDLWALYEDTVRQQKLIPISSSNNEALSSMSASLDDPRHAEAKEILSQDGAAELSAFYTDPEYDVECKIRPDWLTSSMVTWDLKSARREVIELGAFEREAYNKKYHWQAAMILDGLTIVTGLLHTDFGFIVFSKEEPYEIAVYPAAQAFIDLGRIEYRQALGVYAQCLKTDIWPSYATQELWPPRWAMKG